MSIETKKKRKRGPSPDPENKRNKRVSVYFSSSEYEKLISITGDKKLVSEHLRNSGLRNESYRVVIPELNREAYASLARLSANLNQVAKSLNVGDYIEIDDIQDALKALRLSLIGVGEGEGG